MHPVQYVIIYTSKLGIGQKCLVGRTDRFFFFFFLSLYAFPPKEALGYEAAPFPHL